MGYHTIGRLAIGKRALGLSSGFAVKVGNDEPGPQRINACSPGEGPETEWGILRDIGSLRSPCEVQERGVMGDYKPAVSTSVLQCSIGVLAGLF